MLYYLRALPSLEHIPSCVLSQMLCVNNKIPSTAAEKHCILCAGHCVCVELRGCPEKWKARGSSKAESHMVVRCDQYMQLWIRPLSAR